MASSDLRAELNCSICLNLYTDPVTLGCGHNFCQVCIGDVLDTQERCGVYSCPECRAEYQDRLSLQRNRKLCNIVEQFLSTHPEQEETTIFCTYCIHSPVPAVKSCLHCEASLCDKHLRVHNKSVEHVITEPTASLGTRKCSLHSEILKYYCTEDAICICVSCCLIGEHKGHKVGSLNESAERKKEKLRNVLENLISKREEAKKRVQSLQEHRKHVQGKSAALAERVTDLIREQLEALEKRVLSEISRQVEQVSLQVSDLIQQLEIKKDELSGKIRLIEKLCKVTDPFTVLQEQESDRAEDSDTEEGDDKDTERDYTNVPPVGDLDEVLISLTLHTGLADIVTTVKSEKGFCMKETTDMLLDGNTAGNCLTLSGDLKTASWTETNQSYPKTPGRFMNYPQVLSLKSLSSGRHYWEIETSESGMMRIGVAYPSIDRKGHLSLVGFNKKSWCLHMRSHHTYSVVHDSKESLLTPELSCKRLGIYLDYEAGRLSFYELSDPIRHLHTFTATFTEPLHAAFWVWKDWVRIRLRN